MAEVASRIVAVSPIYGWGWADTEPGTPGDYVPPPFHVNVIPKTEVWHDKPIQTLQGVVTEPIHPMDGYSVLLSQRHVGWDGFVNITLKSGHGREVSGYGAIDLASFNG